MTALNECAPTAKPRVSSASRIAMSRTPGLLNRPPRHRLQRQPRQPRQPRRRQPQQPRQPRRSSSRQRGSRGATAASRCGATANSDQRGHASCAPSPDQPASPFATPSSSRARSPLNSSRCRALPPPTHIHHHVHLRLSPFALRLCLPFRTFPRYYAASASVNFDLVHVDFSRRLNFSFDF